MKWTVIDGAFNFQDQQIVFDGADETYKDENGNERVGQRVGIAMNNQRFASGEITASVEFSEIVDANACELLFYFDPARRWFASAGIGGLNYSYFIRHWDGQWKIHASAGNKSNLKPNQVYDLHVKRRGSHISLAVDEVEVLAATLPFPLPQSQTGIHCMDKNDIKISNFSVLANPGRAFIVMQYSKPFNELYDEVIRNVCQDFGVEAHRADETFGPGLIITDMLREIAESEYVNGMDNIKEAENHFFGRALAENGINLFTFDGPGQAELWKDMKFDLDYYESVSAVIDWMFANSEKYKMNLDKIATVGFSLGGHLAPLAATHDKRICCTVGNSGFAQIGGVDGARKLNPIWQRGINFMTGFDDFEEAVQHFDLDITKAPPLECPLLFFHAGNDEVMPSPKKQADTFMNWAKGEKELKYYPEAEHCTVDRLDEVFPYVVDWVKNKMR